MYYASTFSLKGSASLIFWIIYILVTSTIFFAPFIYRLRPTKDPGFFYNALQWIGHVVFGIYSIVIVFIFLNIVGVEIYGHWRPMATDQKIFVELVLAIFSLVATFLVMTVGFFQATKKPEIKNVRVSIEGLPEDFHGLKILQMSDIHIGQTLRGKFADTLVQISNALAPDVVVLTGDLIDGSYSQLADELLAFKGINAPMGKFMVPGNHEYYWGVSQWIEFWKKIGFSTLLNQHEVLEKNGVQLVMGGVHDYSVLRISGETISSPEEAFKGAPASAIKILLAHQPRSVYEAEKAGVHLQLSGHTHSGQYFPYNFIIYLFQPYVKGLNRHKKTWIYVNQGTGYWGPPTRFGVPPEITIIELVKASE